jgi:hypothetical protein
MTQEEHGAVQMGRHALERKAQHASRIYSH